MSLGSRSPGWQQQLLPLRLQPPLLTYFWRLPARLPLVLLQEQRVTLAKCRLSLSWLYLSAPGYAKI